MYFFIKPKNSIIQQKNKSHGLLLATCLPSLTSVHIDRAQIKLKKDHLNENMCLLVEDRRSHSSKAGPHPSLIFYHCDL